jgi:hypothetical protein
MLCVIVFGGKSSWSRNAVNACQISKQKHQMESCANIKSKYKFVIQSVTTPN